jgi:enamine deaminase RidA (YjgF/YER057c/UK114 family)
MEVIVVDERFNGSLENQVKQALTSLKRDIQEKGYNIKSIIKLNVFIKTDGEVEFFEIKEEIETLISKLFSGNIPAYTIIGQPPVAGNSILLEGYILEKKAGLKIERYKLSKHHYVVVSYSKGKRREIYSGGITIDKSRDFISDCQNAFDFAEQLLMKEDMNFGNIVRQWNYIPSILSVNKFENGSLQNYQIFNDIRALYFDPDMFKNGFPAATGIGANYGSVIIDFIAVNSEDETTVIPIKSPVQQNAYSYSEKVLEGEALSGESGKKPPLFERGKLVSYTDRNYVFISGTASIKGENTISTGDVEEQTKITIDNIKELTVKKNMESIGVAGDDTPTYDYVRVYMKNRTDFNVVKKIVEQQMKVKDIIYVEADICRNNLLVEIEADIVMKK